MVPRCVENAFDHRHCDRETESGPVRTSFKEQLYLNMRGKRAALLVSSASARYGLARAKGVLINANKRC